MNKSKSFRRILIYTTLVFFVVIFLIPAYMVITTSLKSPIQISLKTAWDLPTQWFFQSFVDAWLKFKPNIINNILFMLMLFGMFIPYQSILIPLFRFLKNMGLYGSISGLVIVHVIYGLPITTLIFRNYYAEIPTEMIEAGKIDGAGFFKIYKDIVFPISLPGFVVVIIWQFTQIWNEFLFAVTLTSGTGNEPITVALSNLAGGRAVNWNLPMAGALMAALPTLVVYLVLGKYFIRGLLAGSVKG
ncbi:MAG: ABC transporter permease [Anaerolineaceae bacterium 4572_5.2]|nr:MAG: ABC transporter permease [Anaerolineaceae bacterium 4572_5.2]